MALLPHFKPIDQGRLRGPWLLTLVVLVACLGLSVLTWLAALRQQGQRDQARLERVVGTSPAAPWGSSLRARSTPPLPSGGSMWADWICPPTIRG